jgi:predicted dehydrogenase
VPLTHSGETGRGTGLADMAEAIQQRRPSRASGELGLHVTEIMESFLVAAQKGKKIKLKSTCKQPAALPAGLPLGKLS